MAMQPAEPVEFFGHDVGVRIERAADGTYLEGLYALDGGGKMRLILATPTRPGLGVKGAVAKNPLLMQGSEGLFTAAPSFGFTSAAVADEKGGKVITLTSSGDGYVVTKELHVPTEGAIVHATVRCQFQRENPVIRYLLDSYAFAPDGKSMKQVGRPDATFAPAIRPRQDGVIGDHFFRSPVVCVQKGTLAASIMPDLDVLAVNRYMPTIVDLDCKTGVVDAPLMSYGFCGQKLVGHVYFANDSSMTQPVPPELVFSHDIMLDAKAQPYAAYEKAAKYQWDKYGHRYFGKILPQVRPFADYAKECYPAAFNEKETGGWFEQTINGQVCGGMPSGWGRGGGWVSWQSWFNQLRTAWGLRWWGKKLGNDEWVSRADKMLNLALAAPMDRGACPTTYDSHKKEWVGSLITPDPKCYYDLTNIAWKGIWMLHWLEFKDCPRRDEIVTQCKAMADMISAKQNADGSIPTWLDKDLNVVPILDHSAQSALPLWFLAEMGELSINDMKRQIDDVMAQIDKGLSKQQLDDARSKIDRLQKTVWPYREQIKRAADFLTREVVNGQYWYDFETFFSCSPKVCFQRDAKADHEAMRDPHTLQAPQNTLSMQWAAEALQAAVTYVDSTELRLTVFAKAGYEDEVARQLQKEGAPFAAQIASWKRGALMALDTMTFYQNVWPISYRKTAYTYGGFGVQNSDGEYNDARQAQFGATLCDFGAALGRRDYFERGVAATRAALTLINDPLHEEYNVYPNANYPLGLEPENDCHGGFDGQAGRTGPDWGELSGLTSMAWLLDKYGSSYAVKDAGTVLVDGGTPPKEMTGETVLKDPVFDMKDWRMPGWTFDGTLLAWPLKNPRPFRWNNNGLPFIGTCENGRGAFEDELVGTVTSPWFTVSKPVIRLKVGGGSLPGVYVELMAGKERVAVARGQDSEEMSEVVWDVSKYAGQRLQIRIVDKETGGWGHINVGNIRCADR